MTALTVAVLLLLVAATCRFEVSEPPEAPADPAVVAQLAGCYDLEATVPKRWPPATFRRFEGAEPSIRVRLDTTPNPYHPRTLRVVVPASANDSLFFWYPLPSGDDGTWRFGWYQTDFGNEADLRLRDGHVKGTGHVVGAAERPGATFRVRGRAVDCHPPTPRVSIPGTATPTDGGEIYQELILDEPLDEFSLRLQEREGVRILELRRMAARSADGRPEWGTRHVVVVEDLRRHEFVVSKGCLRHGRRDGTLIALAARHDTPTLVPRRVWRINPYLEFLEPVPVDGVECPKRIFGVDHFTGSGVY